MSAIDMEKSYLAFDVELKADVGSASVNFGSGSAMNLINQTTVRSRAGVELDRIENANQWSRLKCLYDLPDSYLKRFGQLEGWGPNRDGTTDSAQQLASGKVRYCLPLTRLAPFFTPLKKGMKLPASLASGLHIEFILEDFRTAFFQKAPGNITGYEISNIYFHLDSVKLSDDTNRVLSQEGASSGLEYCYNRVYTSINSQPSGQASVNIQLRKAVSVGCKAYTVVVDQADVLDVSKDSFASVPWDTTSFQYKLGQIYLPNAPQNDLLVDGKEAYIQTQNVWDKIDHPFKESAVSLSDFQIDKSVIPAILDKDTSLAISGLPIRVC
jgi:hypothetical protein